MGDEIMALGRAEIEYRRTGRKVNIVDATGKTRTHELWKGNPAWSKDGAATITDAPGARPYIKRWDGRRAIYDLSYRPHAGKIHLTKQEIAFSADLDFAFAVVSPLVKGNASSNKDWGEDRWEEVIRGFPIPVLQLGQPEESRLPSAVKYPTPTMRHAASVVSRAAIVLTNEGGLHHVAASMGRPAVVVHGGFTPPLVTGYKTHANLTGDTGHAGCGRWDACSECAKALDKITPRMVIDAVKGLMNGHKEP